jgi:alanine dehydrogenase
LVRRVSPGTHINAIGADAEGKQEINPEILKQAKLVVDDWGQASHSGEINVPLANEQLTEMDIYAELGEIAARKKKGRSSNAEITLFDSTGLAIQDVSCAYTVYKYFHNKNECLEIELF